MKMSQTWKAIKKKQYKKIIQNYRYTYFFKKAKKNWGVENGKRNKNSIVEIFGTLNFAHI